MQAARNILESSCNQAFIVFVAQMLTLPSPTHLSQDLYSISSSTAEVQLDQSQLHRDTSLSDDIDTTAEGSFHSSTGSEPTRHRRLVDSKINEQLSQPYRFQIPRTLSEYEHPAAEYRQAQIAHPLDTSREYSISPTISYPHKQVLLCRWLYETANANMTMAEILEKSNWEERRLEKL